MATLISVACSRGGKPDHVFVVTIDTLRADHLGMYGYFRPTSPFMDSLAAKGHLFMNAIAASSHTVPSHASIFTSLQPAQHGALLNGTTLKESFLTMAEFFQKQGYRTAAFVSVSYLGSLKQGFEHFDAPVMEKHWRFRSASRTVDRMLLHMKQSNRGDKTFTWVHFFDPHEYTPKTQDLIPPANLSVFSGEKARQNLPQLLLKHHGLRLNSDTSSIMNDIDRYDAQILTVDRELKRFHSAMEQTGHNRNALWIIVGDHGEGLGNHHYMGHGKRIYQEQLRVPLVYNFSDHRFRPSRIKTLTGHVDILPTIAELLQFTLTDQIIPVEGRTRAGFLEGKKKSISDLHAFAQRKGEEKGTDDVWEKGELYSLQDSKYKLIIHTAGTEEFYDLHNDPFEQNNIQASPVKRGMRKSLVQMYRRFLEQSASVGITKPAIEPEYVEDLKALGYLN